MISLSSPRLLSLWIGSPTFKTGGAEAGGTGDAMGASEGHDSSTVLANGALILTFLTLNSSLNLLNRWALGIYGFRYPILMTVCHMAFSVTVLAPFMFFTSLRHKHAETLKTSWKGIACIGCFMAVNISLNNLSLVYITLSLNQLIRASLPVMTALLAVVVENKKFNRAEFLSLCVLALGTMLTMYEGTLQGSLEGICICVIGLVSNALMMTFSGKILKEKLDVFRLTFYTSPVSMIVLTPFLFAMEWNGFTEYWATHQGGVTGVLLAGSINAVMYNVVHYLMIQRISSTGTTVVGEIKIVGLLILSTMLLGETGQWTVPMVAGTVVAMAGFIWYSQVKLAAASVSSSKSPSKKGKETDLLGSISNASPHKSLLAAVTLIAVYGIYSFAYGLQNACQAGLAKC